MCGETGGKGNSRPSGESGADFDLDSPAEWIGVGTHSVFVATQSEVRLYDTDGAFERALERVDGLRAMTSLTAPSGSNSSQWGTTMV